MTFIEIARWRLVHQQLANAHLKTAQEMVQWLAAVQGQEYGPTKWGLGLRLPHLKEDEIERDFAAGHLLRTHLLRPTWHVVAAKDIRWLLALTAQRVHQANGYMYRKLELDDAVFNKCRDLLEKMLEGGLQLTRDEINHEFKKHNIVATGHRLSYLMMHAELEGIVCSGARQGNQFTYALLDERVKSRKTLQREEALAELAKRYLMSRGPATVKDFATWSGLTLTDARKGFVFHTTEIQKLEVEGEGYYFWGSDLTSVAPIERLYLLPIYDEFIMGYKEREAYFVLKNSQKLSAGFQYDSMVVWDGQIIGTWARTIQPSTVSLTCQFFKPLTKAQSKALEDALEHFGKFVGKKVQYGNY